MRHNLPNSGFTAIELLIASAIGVIGMLTAGSMIVSLIKSNEAMNHAVEMHRTVVFLGTVFTKPSTAYMKLVENAAPTDTQGEIDAANAHPCRSLDNLIGIPEAPQSLPLANYPRVLKSFNHGESLTYKGSNLIRRRPASGRASPGEAESIELIQLAPRLSYRPKYIHTILRIVSAEVNSMSPKQTTDLPIMWELSATNQTDKCEQSKLRLTQKSQCESLGRYWNPDGWKCQTTSP